MGKGELARFGLQRFESNGEEKKALAASQITDLHPFSSS
jgi:hypothetical protein